MKSTFLSCIPVVGAHSCKHFLLVVSLVLAFALSFQVEAQTDPNLENGFKPYGSYSGSNIDTINLENGNLMLHIPMPFSYPQRGKLQPSYFLGISSKQWSTINPCAPSVCTTWTTPFPSRTIPPVPVLRGLGFDNSLDVVVMRTTHRETDAINPGLASGSNDSVTAVVTADGASHKTTGTIFVQSPDLSSSYFATNVAIDLSGYTVLESGPDAQFIPTGVVVQDKAGNVSAITAYKKLNCTVKTRSDGEPPPNNGTITDTDCTEAATITTWTDPNGNQINFGGQDTMGRTLTQQGFSGTQSTTDYSGCVSPSSQPISTATISNYSGFNGATNQIKVCSSNLTLATNFGISGIAECCASGTAPVSVIVSVVFLVDNSTWSFQYDSYGNITYVGLPLGGSIQYQWETVQLPAAPPALGPNTVPASRAVSKRTLIDNNGNTYVTNYQYQNATYPNSVTNVMTDALGNDTVNTFAPLTTDTQLSDNAPMANNDASAYYLITSKTYQGSQGGGNLLKQEDLQYYNNGQTGASSVINAFATQITTTINGKVSRVTRTPDAGGYGSNLPNFGVATVEKQYDFGSAGPLIRETDTSYTWQGTSATAQQYLAANMIALPSSVQIKDANGNVCAETDNGYDDPSRLTAYTGTIPNHGAPPSAVRGNLTSVGRKLTTTACSVTTSTPSVTAYTNWYDTGQIYQQSDPLGNQTTHSYDPVYAGAFSTKTCDAANQCISGTYDFTTGLLTSFTNANATTQASGNTPGDTAHTSSYNYDALSRMLSATFPPDPDNGNAQAVTQFAYPMPLTLPFTVTSTKSVASGVSPDSVTTTYDGMGRVVKTVHSSAGNAAVITQYDGLDHVISVTNPYFSTSDPTYGITQSYYDALGRAVQIAPQDGTSLPSGTAPTQCQVNNTCTDYSQFPVVTVTDPAGKMRRSRTDAVGRLVEVDEPGPGANTAGSPGQGSITISGSLYSSTSSGTKATGSVTVSGQVQQVCTYVTVCNPDTGLCTRQRQCHTDQGGTVTITVNGHADSYNYGTHDTASSVASGLVSGINADGSAVVWASGPSCPDATDCTISLQARTPGPDYSLSAQGVTNDPNATVGSFDGTSASGSALSGGVYPVTTYDSGTLTVTVGGFPASASYNQNLNTTALAMAQALTSALNASGSPVTASNNNSTTITMMAKGVGTATDFTVAGGSTTSFTASSTTLSGGTNPGGLYAAYVTNYSYDPLGNLLQVNQLGDGSQGARVRNFTYDTLSRLLTSQNPETGTISYSYDADGNMLQKTAPQPNAAAGSTATQTISYCYDNLNRVTGKAYSAQSCSNGQLPAGTAVVTYAYDAGGATANAIGRLTSLTDQAGSASYVYNVLGRMTSESRTVISSPNNVSETVGYTYHLGGSLKTLTYPSGSVITYTPDAAGRDVSAADNGAGINYVSGASFGADGSLTGFVSGASPSTSFNGITSAFSYNKRLQPLNLSAASPTQTVFSLSYDVHLGNGDNGSIFGITNNKDNNLNQSFTYDQLNRLSSAQNAGTDCTQKTANNLTQYWGNNYGYDAWGNLLSMTVTRCSSDHLNLTADAQNRIHTVSGTDYSYDAAGNMTHDATANANYSYDQENRISATGGYTYGYDGAGRRVKKSNGSNGTIYWYAAVGVIAESDLSGNMQHEYVFFAGRRVARKDLPGKSVLYYFSDHLHSASVITDSAGVIKAESDYRPFGAELQFVNNDGNDYKFTGKKRDLESGLDFLGARYYSSAFGRFVTPDWSAAPATVPYGQLGNPQTLNLYSYVNNTPINGIDADGHAAREYMVYDAGSWGPNMFVGGPVIETDWSGTATVSFDTQTNIATVLSIQVTSVTEGLADSLGGTTTESESPGTSQPTQSGAQQDVGQQLKIPFNRAFPPCDKVQAGDLDYKSDGGKQHIEDRHMQWLDTHIFPPKGPSQYVFDDPNFRTTTLDQYFVLVQAINAYTFEHGTVSQNKSNHNFVFVAAIPPEVLFVPLPQMLGRFAIGNNFDKNLQAYTGPTPINTFVVGPDCKTVQTSHPGAPY